MGGRPNPVIKSTRLYLALAVFVLPYVLLILPGIPRWLGRTVAVTLFVFLLSVCVFWFGVSPKSKIIHESGKLSQPQYDKVRPKIELGIRAAIVFLGVLFCFTATYPLALDLAHLAVDRKPTIFVGTVVDRSTPFMGVLLLAGSVRLSRVGPSYYLLYSRAQPHLGESYEFLVLPRSRFIVDFRSLPAPLDKSERVIKRHFRDAMPFSAASTLEWSEDGSPEPSVEEHGGKPSAVKFAECGFKYGL